MANSNTVFGARFSHTPFSDKTPVNAYVVVATDATALFIGDFVKLTGESAVSDIRGFGYRPVVTQAAATETLVGWVEGFGVHPDYLNQLHRTASTLRTVFVCDDPMAHFIIQSTGTGASGDIGQNADITVAAGSTVTGLSGMQLDHSTLGAGSAQLRIVGINSTVGSEFGAYTKFLCFINEHNKKGTTGV